MATPLLYGPHFSYFLRSVRLLMNIKGFNHEITKAPRGEEIPFFGEEHQKLHPFMKIPVLVHGDLVLPETLAIAWFVESQPGPSFLPGNTVDQAKVLSMASMISSYVHKAIMVNFLLEFRFPKGSQGAIRYEVIEASMPQAEQALSWLAEVLDNRRYILGEQFTLADAYLIPMLDYLAQMHEPYNLSAVHTSLCSYVEFHREQAYSQGVLGASV
ncbi:glutathione S-transferase [Alteromonadaceae bacterium Bs31]|nr:glutathione S-transferase [Alteromonadaceae bacterium Bs31]